MFTYVSSSGSRRLRESTWRRPRVLREDPQDRRGRGRTVERFLAVMGPWEYFGIFEYPDLEAAFRVLGKIAKLEMFETETFPAEDVKLFWKALV